MMTATGPSYAFVAIGHARLSSPPEGYRPKSLGESLETSLGRLRALLVGDQEVS